MTAPNTVNDCGTSEETSETIVPVGGLVKQEHGGAIRRGNPGNKGGGVSPSRLREALRMDFARRRKALRDIADNAPKDSDRLGAINLMARYGIGTETTMTIISPDVVDRIGRTIQAVMRCELPDEAKERLLQEIEAAWE